jgi:hypothetical protein
MRSITDRASVAIAAHICRSHKPAHTAENDSDLGRRLLAMDNGVFISPRFEPEP